MIVVNKRYYDYDYDNNTIVMFDAEDVALTLDLELESDDGLNDKEIKENEEELDSNKNNKIKAIESQSTDTVPDSDILLMGPSGTPNIEQNEEEKAFKKATPSPSPKSKPLKASKSLYSSSSNGVSWISSSSPKGSRRIPYALHIAHSYTINKLQVQLTQLVDTNTIQKQKKKKKELKLQQQAIYNQHHGHHHQHQHAQYPPVPYPQYVRHPIPAHPGHPGPAQPHYAQYPPSYAQRPYISPPHYPPHHTPPHRQRHAAHTQRKQEIQKIPTSPSGRYNRGTSQQYISYHTNNQQK